MTHTDSPSFKCRSVREFFKHQATSPIPDRFKVVDQTEAAKPGVDPSEAIKPVTRIVGNELRPIQATPNPATKPVAGTEIHNRNAEAAKPGVRSKRNRKPRDRRSSAPNYESSERYTDQESEPSETVPRKLRRFGTELRLTQAPHQPRA